MKTSRVIVADNASSDDSVTYEPTPPGQLLQNSTNGRFARGLQYGAKSRLQSDYVW